jgi:hypothetical protein
MALLQKAYLGATPLFRNVDWFEDGAFNIVNAGSAVTVTANASANVKGSWSPLVTSTSANASMLVFYVDNVGTTSANTAVLIDIGTGASGAETAIASNIGVGAATATAGTLGIVFGFPFKVPSGTRISARIQAVIGGDTARVVATVIDAGDYATAPTSVDSTLAGGDTSNSQGTSFSGASGAWTVVAASTTQAYRAVVLTISSHTDTAANVTGTFEIGVGSSGNEVSFGTNLFNIDTNERAWTRSPFSYLFGRSIPAGSRLAIRHNIGADPSKYGFNLIGIP